MSVPELRVTRLVRRPGRPLLVLGPSLGTTARGLYAKLADELGARFDVVAWDLPGHGASPLATAGFSVAELASAVADLPEVAEVGAGVTRHYVGDSLGGAVGLQLLLDRPQLFSNAVLLSTGAQIGTVEGWRDRAGLVRRSGIDAVMQLSSERWFAPGFGDRDPVTVAAMLGELGRVDDASYAWACEALADFDVRNRLLEIDVEVLAVAGSADLATPPERLAEVAHGVCRGRLVVIDDVAHLPPAERPSAVAALIDDHVSATQTHHAGMAVRRAVLGDAHVDRANSAATAFTRDFQDHITRYAWGGVWTRDVLDRRSRSMITLALLTAGGHHEELGLHTRAARTNGLSDDEIAEVLLHASVYCGVPAANTAFRIAAHALAAMDQAEQ